MGGKEFIAWVMVVFLSLWSALYLETGLENYFVLELFVILLLIIISVGILYSLAAGKEWVWGALLIFFAVSIINSILVYLEAGNTTPFMLALFVNIAGIIMAVSKHPNISLTDDAPAMPTSPVYHVEERDLISNMEFESFDSYYEGFEEGEPKKTNKKKTKKKSKKRK